MTLTQEELDIVTHMMRGLRPKQIFVALNICKSTFSRRRQAIMRKLRAKNDFQVGMFAAREGVLPDHQRAQVIAAFESRRVWQ